MKTVLHGEEKIVQQQSDPETMTSKDLLNELMSDASLLIKRQVRLAQLEATHELKQGKTMATYLGAAGVLGFCGLVLLLVTAALAIGAAIGAFWGGALIVAGALLFFAATAAGIGYLGRVKKPLSRTRREIEKEITWAKQHRTTT